MLISMRQNYTAARLLSTATPISSCAWPTAKTRLGERAEVPDWRTMGRPAGCQGHGRRRPLWLLAHTYYFGPMGQYDIPRSWKAD